MMASPSRLILSADLLARIVGHARASRPHEAVGVLGGCALAFSLGALSVIGLSAAVATGLGFGAFMGTVLGSARHV